MKWRAKMSSENKIQNNSKITNRKLVIHLKFKSLLKFKSRSLLKNINNYDESHICKICNKQIQDLGNLDYLNLYGEENDQFITFHFKCAFRRNTGEKFSDIASEFDYIYYNNNHKK